jgi:hypothetical protein
MAGSRITRRNRTDTHCTTESSPSGIDNHKLPDRYFDRSAHKRIVQVGNIPSIVNGLQLDLFDDFCKPAGSVEATTLLRGLDVDRQHHRVCETISPLDHHSSSADFAMIFGINEQQIQDFEGVSTERSYGPGSKHTNIRLLCITMSGRQLSHGLARVGHNVDGWAESQTERCKQGSSYTSPRGSSIVQQNYHELNSRCWGQGTLTKPLIAMTASSCCFSSAMKLKSFAVMALICLSLASKSLWTYVGKIFQFEAAMIRLFESASKTLIQKLEESDVNSFFWRSIVALMEAGTFRPSITLWPPSWTKAANSMGARYARSATSVMREILSCIFSRRCGEVFRSEEKLG